MKIYLMVSLILISGCSHIMGNATSQDPIERGLSYIAGAIVVHGILRILG